MRQLTKATACGMTAMLVCGLANAALPKPPPATANSFLMVGDSPGFDPYFSTGRIYIGDAVTGTTYKVTDGPEATQDSQPAWSGSGSQIAYIRYGDPVPSSGSTYTTTLYVVNLQTMQQTPLTVPSRSTLKLPAWKGDTQLAYVVEPYVRDRPASTCVRVYTNLPSRNRKTVHCFDTSRGGNYVSQLQWTPDGKGLIISMGRGGQSGAGFDVTTYKVDVASGQATTLSVDRDVRVGYDVETVISFDAAQAYISSGFGYSQDWTNLKTGEVIKDRLPTTSPRFSNDNKRLAVQMIWETGGPGVDFPQIVVMNEDGTAAVPVTTNDSLTWELSPADWSADDKTLLINSQPPGNVPTAVQTVDIASKTTRTIGDGFVGKNAWFKPAR